MANWICPYCQHAQAETGASSDYVEGALKTGDSKYGRTFVRNNVAICANHVCGEIVLSTTFFKLSKDTLGNFAAGTPIQHFLLLPASFAKPQPSFIPDVLVSDYKEACAIRDLSPKASATLSRRCIQGILRDFCGISKSRLIDEINELSNQVTAGTAPSGVNEDIVKAIDHVREIGNIGAHMERDINVIVDVDPNEAQILINLIELLFDELYVARERRKEKLDHLAKVAASKKVQKTGEKEGLDQKVAV